MVVRRFWTLALLILVAASCMVAANATSGRPMETHEDFVAQTSREMIASGDLVVPTFGGEQRLQKPPLMYWAVVGVASAADRPDVPPWTARLPSAFASVVLVAAGMMLAAVVYDRRTALLTGGFIACCAGVFRYGGNARPEMLYAACTVVATLGFVHAWFNARNPGGLSNEPAAPDPTDSQLRRAVAAWAIVGWAAFAAAVLAKGPQLPALVFVGLSFWMVREGGWRMWRSATGVVWGLPLALALITPWFILVAVRVDGAAAFWLNELIGLRFGGDGQGNGLVQWLLGVLTPEYLLYIVSELLPWGLALPLAACVVWVRGRPDLARGRVLFFAAAVPLLVLSLASHSRGYYLLPILPIVAVLLARGVLDVLDKAVTHRRLQMTSRATFWLAAAVAGITVLVVNHVLPVEPGPALDLSLEITGLAVVVVLGLWLTRHEGAVRPVAAAVLLWGWAFAALTNERLMWSDRDEQIDALAREAARLVEPGMEIVTVGFDRDDLVYAVNGPVGRVARSAHADELIAMGPIVLVGPTRELDELAAEGLILERLSVFEIEPGEQIQIARANTGR